MPRNTSPPKLLVPSGEIHDQLGMVNELLAQRQAELSRAQHDLNLTRATIQTERMQWEKQQQREQDAAHQETQEEKARLQEQFAAVDRVRRQAEEAKQRAEDYEEEKRSGLLMLREREAAVMSLNQERLDVAKLRQKVETQQHEVNDRFSMVQTAQNDANAKLLESKRLMEECELRNKLMNDEWNRLTKWQEELNLRQRDYDIVKAQVETRLQELQQKEAQPKEGVDAHAG